MTKQLKPMRNQLLFLKNKMIIGVMENVMKILQIVCLKKIKKMLKLYQYCKIHRNVQNYLHLKILKIHSILLQRKQLCILKREKSKKDNKKDAISIFNFIHEYSIKFEENIFRKDYLLKYL